jgi:hypothetical protein
LTYLAVLVTAALLTGACGRTVSRAGNKSASDTTGTAMLTFTAPEHMTLERLRQERRWDAFSHTPTPAMLIWSLLRFGQLRLYGAEVRQKACASGPIRHHRGMFDTSGREGVQTKTVVVQSNAENNLVILRIIADVTKSGS